MIIQTINFYTIKKRLSDLTCALQSLNNLRATSPHTSCGGCVLSKILQPIFFAEPSLTWWAGSGRRPARRRCPAETRCSSAPRACWCRAARTRSCGRIPTGCLRRWCRQIPVRLHCQSCTPCRLLRGRTGRCW